MGLDVGSGRPSSAVRRPGILGARPARLAGRVRALHSAVVIEARPCARGGNFFARACLPAILALTLAGPATTSAAAPGKRVTIAVFGDSVAEGYTVPAFLRRALVPQIGDALGRRGFAHGGPGLIPAMPYRWRFTRPRYEGQVVPSDGWRMLGARERAGFDGPSGYSAVATSPAARASVAVRGPLVAILYTTTKASVPFAVRAGSRIWRLDPFAAGEPRPAEAWLRLPRGARSITVYGPHSGALTFSGAIDRRPVGAGKVQVEVSNLAHAGHVPDRETQPRIIQSVAAQRYGVTIFLWGYVSQLGVDLKPKPGDLGDRYERALLGRARLARSGGGECLVADATPMPVAAVITRRFAAIHRRVAAKAGCAYTGILARLWTHPSTAFDRGITQIDNIHPTPATYRRMAESLAPLLAKLVRRRAAAGP